MIRRVVVVLGGLLLGGCVAVTVNVNFPQDTIDKAASSIEDEVRTPSSPPAPKRGALRSALPGTPYVEALVDAGRTRYRSAGTWVQDEAGMVAAQARRGPCTLEAGCRARRPGSCGYEEPERKRVLGFRL